MKRIYRVADGFGKLLMLILAPVFWALSFCDDNEEVEHSSAGCGVEHGIYDLSGTNPTSMYR